LTRIDQPWLHEDGTAAVCAALTAAGHRALFVGGCVRDALLGRSASDIDIATDAEPETVVELAAAAGLRSVPTGIEHGTVTVIASGRPFEVTTFRRDVETDGRRATVAFSTDIAEDAKRRDFTMNALYARPDGAVEDPLGGLADLREGRVRFVGDPDERIAEDTLRILRFFRFHAWYGDSARGLDPDGLAACAAGADGLDALSRERVGAEMTRLLSAPDPAPALAAMAASGILARVLPGADASAIAPLVHLELALGADPSWRRRLAALGWREAWADLLRLSKADRRALDATVRALEEASPPAATAFREGPEAARDAALIVAASVGAPPPDDLETEVARGAAAEFPLRAADLDLAGEPLGHALKALQEAWIRSEFTLGADDLRALLEGKALRS
jgi:poly(A) polymerase